MGRGTFNANNKTIESVVFYTTSNSGTTFDPQISRTGGARVSIDWGDGSPLESGNSLSHTYADNGDVKTVTVLGNNTDTIYQWLVQSDDIYGHLDLTGTKLLNAFYSYSNPNLTGITFSSVPQTNTGFRVYSSGLVGNLDVSMFTSMNDFRCYSNSNLTGITHGSNPTGVNSYLAYSNDLTGTLDVSQWTNLDNNFSVYSNPNLTKILHYSANTGTLTYYSIRANNLTGHHDMSGINLAVSGSIFFDGNSNLTGLTQTVSQGNISTYWGQSCDLTGSFDLTMYPNLGGGVILSNNPNMTAVIHTASTRNITSYWQSNNTSLVSLDLSMLTGLGTSSTQFDVSGCSSLTGLTFPSTSASTYSTFSLFNCDFTGVLDMSPMTNLSANVSMYSNSNLTNLLFSESSESVILRANQCTSLGSDGPLDLSPLTGLYSSLRLHHCTSLSGITFPLSTETFNNTTYLGSDASQYYAFSLYSCSLDYINFLPLSGATFDVNNVNGANIALQSNNMSSGDVNHILVDLDNMSTNLNPAGWTGGTLNISGSNGAPDTTSGGYNGISAISSLTGATNQWTITTS
jgi:hypothetical protein